MSLRSSKPPQYRPPHVGFMPPLIHLAHYRATALGDDLTDSDDLGRKMMRPGRQRLHGGTKRAAWSPNWLPARKRKPKALGQVTIMHFVRWRVGELDRWPMPA